jgi:hypothetical protein
MLIVNSLLKINNSNVCPPSHWNQNYEGISDVFVILTFVWKGLPKFSESLKLVVKLLMEKHVFWWVRNSLVGVMKFCGRCLMGRDDLQLFHYLAVVFWQCLLWSLNVNVTDSWWWCGPVPSKFPYLSQSQNVVMKGVSI